MNTYNSNKNNIVKSWQPLLTESYVVANHTFFNFITFSRTNSFAYINSIVKLNW